MTWVIGSSTMFGYGIVMSDIRVTCTKTGNTMDVLQKAFPVGRFIVAGLAGDVGIGFTLLRSMVAVGTLIAQRPPHRSQRAELPHWAPTLDNDGKRCSGYG